MEHFPLFLAMPNLDTYLEKKCNSVDFRTVGGEVQKVFCRVVNTHHLPLHVVVYLMKGDPVPFKLALSELFGMIRHELAVGSICRLSTYTEKLRESKQKNGWTSLSLDMVEKIYPFFRQKIEDTINLVRDKMLTFDWRIMADTYLSANQHQEKEQSACFCLWNDVHVFSNEVLSPMAFFP